MGAYKESARGAKCGVIIRTSRQSTNRSFRTPATRFERIGERTINKPVIIPRAQHIISRELISENALKVLYRLKDAGYASLLVGGCVRDLMLGREPKDFDVVTDARPEDIRKLFHSARVIGRRFRLVHVRFGWEIIEVATFRAIPRDIAEESISKEDEAGELAENSPSPEPGDHNIFGSQEEDAVRRDFTVNALYYDIRDFTVLDYAGGVTDLKAGILRVIGDPEARYREDPVRMLRAIRFAAKLGFKLEEKTAAPIRDLAPLLTTVPPARMFEEVLKLFHGGYALETYELLRHYGLFQHLFPLTEKSLEHEEEGFPVTLVPRALSNTDTRINEDKPVTPAFLFAAILWEPVRQQASEFTARGMHSNDAMFRAAEDVLHEQLQYVSIPKRFSVPMREIWSLQARFDRRAGMQAFRLLENKRFRAAYDFLLLRAESGEADRLLADWWTRFQAAEENERRTMVAEVAPTIGTSKQRSRRRRSPSGQIPRHE
jgi:poly(A) polymerase